MEFWKLNCVLDYRYSASKFKIENFYAWFLGSTRSQFIDFCFKVFLILSKKERKKVSK